MPKLPLIRTKQAARKRLPGSEGLAYDCVLAAGISEGDTASLDRLLERHAARVNRYLNHRLGTGHEMLVQTIVKATFDEALQHIRPYAKNAASTPMEYWLVRLAERNLIKTQKAPVKAQAAVEKTKKPEAKDESDLAIVRRAMAKIPVEESFVIALALFEGMSAPEIALTLGTGQASSMKKLRSALAALSRALPASEGAV
jgi:DNA-directed RNA polymerase specialized sigma24 family protein